MMNYKSIRSDKVNLFDVHESLTDQIILSGLTSDVAKKTTRHLNMGGGFDGNTPSFFLAIIPRPNLAESFA
jgi:hypothetical protein